jgi:hypothetical protein
VKISREVPPQALVCLSMHANHFEVEDVTLFGTLQNAHDSDFALLSIAHVAEYQKPSRFVRIHHYS